MMLTGLCGHVGVTLATTTFINETMPIKFNFIGKNVTGRQVLKWIAEVAAKYAVINEQGQLKLGWYSSIVYSINNSNYYNLKIEDYQVKKIDKLQVQVVENDIGVIVGTGNKCLCYTKQSFTICRNCRDKTIYRNNLQCYKRF